MVKNIGELKGKFPYFPFKHVACSSFKAFRKLDGEVNLKNLFFFKM
jgi:hypothetical protein